MTRKRRVQTAAESPTTAGRRSNGFTDDERAAMMARAREIKTDASHGAHAGKQDGERAVLERIAEMQGPDRLMARRLHTLIMASASALSPRTWYGMPAYAKDGKVVCFFQSAGKFKARYATLGFSDAAHLDDGAMWATAFALKEFTAAEERRIVALVKQAVTSV